MSPTNKASADKAVTTETLAQLFEPDRIRDFSSVSQIEAWGRYHGLFKQLGVDVKVGIDSDAYKQQGRRAQFGANTPILKPQKSFLDFVIETFEDAMLRVLCVAALSSLFLGILTEGIEEGWLEGGSILFAVVLIVSVTSCNNYAKQQQFKKLNAVAQMKNVNVLRDGSIKNISVYDLLVGDVVEVETGEIVSVDGLLIKSNDLVLDESAITGESKSIRKTVPDEFTKAENANPFLVSGSRVLEGTGMMVVLAVGVYSRNGKIKLTLQASQDETPLQQKLEILAEQIGNVGMIAAAATFLAMLLHLIWDIIVAEDRSQYLSLHTVMLVVDYFIIGISIIVVAVPEGLPLAVTIALAYSVGKMRQENNLVRYLAACETMGGANNICTDKTGTLTKNLMEVVTIFDNQSIIHDISDRSLSETTRRNLGISACLNSNAHPVVGENGRFQQIGNKTECALLEMAYKIGYDFRKIRGLRVHNTLKLFPFSSAVKKMGVIYENQSGVYLSVKGAPEQVIQSCTHYFTRNGEEKRVDEAYRTRFQNVVSSFASQSLRTLLIAQKKFTGSVQDAQFEAIVQDLIIVGVVGIKDPLRPQIVESVQKCKEAGITVRMLTGDNIETAIAIAKESGILRSDYASDAEAAKYSVMEGREFRTFVGGIVEKVVDGEKTQVVGNLDNFRKIQKYLRVLARSTPEDKYIMATGLKQLDDVVAMTGDGTNDAPALKKADIGFAMGIAGTDVAKQAAGIILLDDNFASIVTAIQYGRNILECIRKFLQFQLTVNCVALVLAFIGSVVLKESPLNPIQMLWVNLIMDTFASLALATEPPHAELLKRKPYSRFESLITPVMWKNILFQAIFQVAVLLTLLFFGPKLLNISSSVGVSIPDWNEQTGKHYSIFFNVFVLMQLFNEINCRKLKNSEVNVFKGFFNNPLFIIIVISTFVIQYLLIELGGKSIRVTSLTIQEHLLCLGIGSLSLAVGVVSKLFGPAQIKIGQSQSEEKKQN